MDLTDVNTALTAMLHKSVQAVVRIGRGGNSKVYRVVCEDGSRYAAKLYFQRTMDGLDRLDVEFSSLRFLWEHGERCVPQPLAEDRRNQIALYQYIDGTEIDSSAVSDPDVGHLVSFAARLRRLAASEQADQLPLAAEACFSFRGLHCSILRRLERLSAVRGGGASYTDMQRFLSQEFSAALDAIVQSARARIGEAAWSAELPRGSWTLSPSDFGFHNALRRPDGSIVLLDFEYFGMDDPAKMISDFLLHPAMELNESIKRSYAERMLECFSSDHMLPDRLTLSYPLFGLKWCMIMLNEFVPKFLERREFAVEVSTDRERVRTRQLEKSQRMLGSIMNELESFPYWTKWV
ncbi:MAG: phosphotransferase [Nitrospiraceae bacterium]